MAWKLVLSIACFLGAIALLIIFFVYPESWIAYRGRPHGSPRASAVVLLLLFLSTYLFRQWAIGRKEWIGDDGADLDRWN
jgi:hypothetical protein